MADLFVWWGQDLTILPTGDVLTCDGTIEGEQRVLRRLLTPPQSYIWHPEYGAGLSSYVGQPAQADAIGSLILAQMLISLSANHRPPTQMPLGQATLFWLKKNMPRTADKVLSQVRAELA